MAESTGSGADDAGELRLSALLCRCIVAAGTGRGVFDGAVRVEQKAQKTDAGQLSRNLLLVPRATVNVKPNLQIVADDVKCTHGCAVSDLEEDQLFYFRQVPDSPYLLLVCAALSSWSLNHRDSPNENRQVSTPIVQRQSVCRTCELQHVLSTRLGHRRIWRPALHVPPLISLTKPLFRATVLGSRARGVDSATARRVLVYSFGAEVTVEWPYQQLKDRIQTAVDSALANVPIMESMESEPVEV